MQLMYCASRAKELVWFIMVCSPVPEFAAMSVSGIHAIVSCTPKKTKLMFKNDTFSKSVPKDVKGVITVSTTACYLQTGGNSLVPLRTTVK